MSLLIGIAFFLILIFKADSIINGLRLDKGFDDDQVRFESINDMTIIKLAIILIGCFLIVDYFPVFMHNAYLGFRESLFNKLSNQYTFATIVHSSCYVDSSVKIGRGTCLLPGSVVDHNSIIGENVLINVGCTIAHDSIIKSHSFLSPSVAIAGFVEVGERCNIGVNSTIIDNIKITDDVQTGGGTVVISDIKNKGLYVGNPSRFIR